MEVVLVVYRACYKRFRIKPRLSRWLSLDRPGSSCTLPSMTKHNQGIPTMYAGVQFRSRSEARWAALFTNLEFTWEYEPADFSGYIPDFYLRGFPAWGKESSLLVEIKGGVDTLKGLQPAVEKIADTAGAVECLVLGMSPSCPVYFGRPVTLRHTDTGDLEPRWALASFHNFYDWISWRTLKCTNVPDTIKQDSVISMFKEKANWPACCNATQWRSPA